jgi:hypothetical protein
MTKRVSQNKAVPRALAPLSSRSDRTSGLHGRTQALYECSACGHQDSITAGTIFHRTKLPLRAWFLAIFLMAVDKGGKSALALSRELGLRYDAAWLMHHKIQWAMTDRNARYQLAGLVELDDAYFGGVSHGASKRGRGTDQDPVVVGVSLNEKGHPQYAFLEVVESLKQDTVLEVLKRRVDESGIWLNDRVGGGISPPSSHTTVRTVRYTAVD